MKKSVKLKNTFTGDIVYCDNMKEVQENDNMRFIKVYRQENPERTFLVNKDAFVVMHKQKCDAERVTIITRLT